jgi:mannose-6-phosphate isomerase-like protein (cupin superfamily)
METGDFDSDANMKRLRELTEKLVSHPLKDIAVMHGDQVAYDCPAGSCIGKCLMSDAAVSVQYAEAVAGTVFPTHSHSTGVVEYLIIIEGELIHEIDGRTVTATAGGYLFVHAGATHSLMAVTDVRMIGVTIPQSEGYPHVG